MSSAAALFAVHARAQQATCGWCLNGGTEKLIYVNGSVILEDHTDCMIEAARDQSRQCACFVKIGDNAECPVHGELLREEC